MKIIDIEWIKTGRPEDIFLPNEMEYHDCYHYDFQETAKELEEKFDTKIKGFQIASDDYIMPNEILLRRLSDELRANMGDREAIKHLLALGATPYLLTELEYEQPEILSVMEDLEVENEMPLD